MTVEHLIGKKQGGYLKEIRLAVAEHFPALTNSEREDLARGIDAVNTVTCCSFCNSTTSQHSCHTSMGDLIKLSTGQPHEVIAKVTAALQPVLEQKRAAVQWKLESVRREYESRFLSSLAESQVAS
jgi:hypothetical protein